MAQSVPGDTNDLEDSMVIFNVGGFECMIVLIVLIIVVALAFRGGYSRGRRK